MTNSNRKEENLWNIGNNIVSYNQVFAASPYDCGQFSEELEKKVNGYDIASNGIITPDTLGINLLIESADGTEDFSLAYIPEGIYIIVDKPDLTKPSKSPIVTFKVHSAQTGYDEITGSALKDKYGLSDKAITPFKDSFERYRSLILTVQQMGDDFVDLKPGQSVFFGYPMGVTP